jgi:hypothetical protein
VKSSFEYYDQLYVLRAARRTAAEYVGKDGKGESVGRMEVSRRAQWEQVDILGEGGLRYVSNLPLSDLYSFSLSLSLSLFNSLFLSLSLSLSLFVLSLALT